MRKFITKISLLVLGLGLIAGCGGKEGGSGKCQPNAERRCMVNELFWFDSCGVQETLIESCPVACANGACSNGATDTGTGTGNAVCTSHASKLCVGNNLFWQNSCGQQQDQAETCQFGCQNSLCVLIDPSCVESNVQAKKSCVGLSVYWLNNCGQPKALVEACKVECKDGACLAPLCTPTNLQAERKCEVDAAYYYDNCGTKKDLIETCAAGTCKNGGCTVGTCEFHAKKKCVLNDLFWYDSCGVQQDKIETCPSGCANDVCTIGTTDVYLKGWGCENCFGALGSLSRAISTKFTATVVNSGSMVSSFRVSIWAVKPTDLVMDPKCSNPTKYSYTKGTLLYQGSFAPLLTHQEVLVPIDGILISDGTNKKVEPGEYRYVITAYPQSEHMGYESDFCNNYSTTDSNFSVKP